MDRVLPGRLLVDIGRSLRADNELRVFGFSVFELAPRTLLGRLCKPYDGDVLETVPTLGQQDRWRECDDVSAGHANGLREAALGFCEKLLALERELDARASRAWVPEERLGAAYLVKALEDMRLDFRERPERHVLHLVSDMMQHAGRYSDLDLDWRDWDYLEFSDLLGSEIWLVEEPRANEGLRVEVFYLPRRGRTDDYEVRNIHQQFWRHYVADSDISFRNQAPMPAYAVRPLMNVLTDAEAEALERREVEQLLERVRSEQRALEA